MQSPNATKWLWWGLLGTAWGAAMSVLLPNLWPDRQRDIWEASKRLELAIVQAPQAAVLHKRSADVVIPETRPGSGMASRVICDGRATDLPDGVCVDLLGSGARHSIALSFGMNGDLERFAVDGVDQTPPPLVHLLVGMSAAARPHPDRYDFLEKPADDDQLAERREQVNWLNPNSLWLTVTTSSGRVVKSAVAAFDPRDQQFTAIDADSRTPPSDQQMAKQLEASRENAVRLKGTRRPD